MKFCPTCETQYDEEILRFCTKDGTPLVDENQPNFTEMPSESLSEAEDDLGEETMLRYKPPKDIIEPEPQPEIDRSEAPRIVISTSEQKREQNVRARTIPPYQPPQKPNVGKTVLLTILGTLAVLAVGLGLFVFLRDEEPAANKNVNVNTNPPDTNINSGINFGGTNYNVPTISNLNANSNFNINFNTNINANLKTPTPTPKPSPSANVNANVNANSLNINTNIISSPTPKPETPTPNSTPRVTPTPPKANPANLPSDRPPGNSPDKKR